MVSYLLNSTSLVNTNQKPLDRADTSLSMSMSYTSFDELFLGCVSKFCKNQSCTVSKPRTWRSYVLIVLHGCWRETGNVFIYNKPTAKK